MDIQAHLMENHHTPHHLLGMVPQAIKHLHQTISPLLQAITPLLQAITPLLQAITPLLQAITPLLQAITIPPLPTVLLIATEHLKHRHTVNTEHLLPLPMDIREVFIGGTRAQVVIRG